MTEPAPSLAVISGAGSGIGRAAARALSGRGWRVALLGRRSAPLEKTLADCGGSGWSFAVDVREPDSVAAVAERLVEEGVAPDAVIAAAGVARVGRFAELPAAAFTETVETNLLGAANLFRAFLPAMSARGTGTLVAIASVAARQVFPGWSAYSASKWGLLGMIGALREELTGTGVRIFTLTPGATETPLWDDVPGDWDRTRMISTEEVAEALLWALEWKGASVVEEIRLQPPGGNL